ncbi:MAG: FAD binding domain-containing protein, partial [Desulfobacterales bacterium]
MFDFDSYHQARSVEEAVALLVQNPQAVPLAGGTDILVRLHQGNPDYRHLVDIHDVSELKGVTLDDQGTLTIG